MCYNYIKTQSLVKPVSRVSLTIFLTQSILSFVITGAVQPQLDNDPSNSDLSDKDDISALAKFDSRKNIAIIRLHCIQTKYVC